MMSNLNSSQITSKLVSRVNDLVERHSVSASVKAKHVDLKQVILQWKSVGTKQKFVDFKWVNPTFRWSLRELLLPYYYYGRYVSEHFGEKGVNVRIRRSAWHYLWEVFTFPFGLTCALILGIKNLNNLPVFDMFYAFMPPFNGFNHGWVTVVIWSAMRLFYLSWALTNRLSTYRFMAVVLVRDDTKLKSYETSAITRRDLDLNETQYRKLSRFRWRVSRIIYTWIAVIIYLSCYSRFKRSLKTGLWQRDFYLTLFWSVNYANMVITTVSLNYGLIVFYLIVIYYLWLKQRDIMKGIDQVIHEAKVVSHENNVQAILNCRLAELNRKYAALYHESEIYARQLRRSVSIQLAGWVVVITYCIYLVLMTRLPLPFKILYSFLFSTHVTMLVTLVLGCALIARANQEVGQRVRCFQIISSRYNLSSLAHRLKILNLLLKFVAMPLKTALKAILRFWIEVWMTHIYYYGHHLYEHGLYFKFPDHEHPARITIRTPLLHKFVDSWGYIFGLCSLMFYFIDHERSLDHIPWFNILRGFMPPVGARSLLIPVMVWSFTRFIYVYFGLSNNLMKYRFMSAMMAKDTDNANIHFSDIGLSQKQYNRLAKYRRRSFVLFVWIFVVFVWLSCSSRFGQAIKHKVHEQNLPATLFWMWIYYNWISMTASFIYAPALCFLNASFVIWMKQRAIREEMNDLAYRIERRLYRPSQVPKNAAEVRLRGYRRFLQLMHQNEIIYHEILTYDQLIGPCLTVLFACYTAIVAFAFYFIIMRALPIFFKLAYWFLFLTHIVMLAMLTFGCGRIASKGLGRKVRHFLEIAGPFYHPCHRLHFQTIASSLLYTKVGFTLLDYRKVKSSTFFTISTYVSTLFFLVFRKAS